MEIVRKLFNLYPGEEKNALIFALLAFLWSLGSYCGVTLSDGMFLEYIGADALPMAYLLTALGLFGVTLLFLYAFNHFNAYRIYLICLSLGSIGYLLIILYFPTHDKINDYTFWFSTKIFCNILAVVLTTCFWFFLDQYFNLQNAKRLYSLFNASVFFGNACGGAFLAFGINSIGMKGIASVIITLFLMTCVWVFFISKNRIPLLTESEEHSETPEKTPLKAVIKGFITSKFTLLIMLFYFMIQLVNVTTEYTYMQSFDAYFDQPRTETTEAENRLTVFLGTTTAWLALANMFFGFFFYSRVVGRFGLNNIVGISPIFFLAAFIAWGFTGALFVAIFGIIIVEGISYTIDENNSNLLLNSVPGHLRNKARVAIDSFFEPLGMLAAALIFLISTASSQTIGLILTIICLAVALMIRKQYPKAILSNLLSSAIHFERKIKQWLSLMKKRERHTAKSHLISLLKSKDESAQLFACQMLLEFSSKTIPRILTAAETMSLKGKALVVQLFDNSPWSLDPRVLDCFNQWLRKFSTFHLRSILLFYLAKRSLLSPNQLKDEPVGQDLMLRGAKILNCHMQGIEELLHGESREICMGLSLLALHKDPKHIELILPCLTHATKSVRIESAKALMELCGPHTRHLSPLLLETLQSIELRTPCLIALGKLNDPSLIAPIILASIHFRPAEKRLIEDVIEKLGSHAISEVLELTQNTSIHDKCRILSAKILGKLDLTLLRSHLHAIVHVEIERAFFYFFHSFEECPLLYKAYESVVDFIIQLLGIAGSIQNSAHITHCLHSTNPKIHSQAIEMLETTCEPKIFGLLKPLIDERPLAEKLHFYRKKMKPATHEELLNILEQAPSSGGRTIALFLKNRSHA